MGRYCSGTKIAWHKNRLDAVLYTVAAELPACCCTRTQHQVQHTNKTSLHIMPCAAGEVCKLPDVELIAPDGRDCCGHECRGGCGDKLHGICGEVEDPDGDSPTHRVCHMRISNRNLSNPAKRKQGRGFVLPRFVALLCIAVL